MVAANPGGEAAAVCGLSGRYAVHEDVVVQQPAVLPVAARTQVLVAGGGTAGLAAAVAAARHGAQVLLVERHGFLGGVPTAAMMGAFVGTHAMRGIGREIVDRLAAAGAAPAWTTEPGRSQTTPFDIESLKFVALDLVQEAGIDLRLYTWVGDAVTAPLARPDGTVVPAVQGLVVEGKEGRQVLLADCVIDCTGDGDICVRAGAQAVKGRTHDGRMRPVTQIFRAGGLDIERVLDYLRRHPDQTQRQPAAFYGSNGSTGAAHLSGGLPPSGAPAAERPSWFWMSTLPVGPGGAEHVVTQISGFYDLVDQARAKGELDEECFYFRLEDCWIERGTAVINTNRVLDVDATRTDDLTRAEIRSREDVRQLLAFMRKYVPGCERAFIIDVAPSLGIRETRHVVGDYFVTEADVYANRRFPDAVVSMSRGLPSPDLLVKYDVHSPDGKEAARGDPWARELGTVKTTTHHFDLPFRCLVPRGIERLLVAGRCMSVNHIVDGSTRNMVTCYKMGEVAGTAAALAVTRRLTPRQVGQPPALDVLRQHLAAAGIAPDPVERTAVLD